MLYAALKHHVTWHAFGVQHRSFSRHQGAIDGALADRHRASSYDIGIALENMLMAQASRHLGRARCAGHRYQQCMTFNCGNLALHHAGSL